ncbi:hypothetical protein [Lysobacter gummosus]|uniref:hypothetical protein n=1 Tax=Lysobacter gummosus TaxID=262324 RepID=UPI00363A0E13
MRCCAPSQRRGRTAAKSGARCRRYATPANKSPSRRAACSIARAKFQSPSTLTINPNRSVAPTSTPACVSKVVTWPR